jgi:ABC-type sulfate transport system substrate-binding protein
MSSQAKILSTVIPFSPHQLGKALKSPVSLVTAVVLAGASVGQFMAAPAVSQQKDVQLTLVSYAVTRSAYEKIIPKFVAKWQKEKGQKITFKRKP